MNGGRRACRPDALTPSNPFFRSLRQNWRLGDAIGSALRHVQGATFMAAFRGVGVVQTIQPAGRELYFERDELIVSKTDLKGQITYANEVFQRLTGFCEAELLGAPHSIVRHPDMPRALFKRIWETIGQGREIFAYIKNITRNGDYYWVLAHVTPSFGPDGAIVGFHSNRRQPAQSAIDAIWPLYQELLGIEAAQSNPKDAIAASARRFDEAVAAKRTSYDEFVLSL